ncbi:MAG: hypothetical protein HYX34_05775 [Actinobacteria bacterium]|nr:hypothetical protein [Actinomycetota bacterium]
MAATVSPGCGGAAPARDEPLPSNARRLRRCVTGLVLCGLGFSALVRAGLGLDAWDVFHQGVARQLGLPIGTVTIGTGFVVLLGWIPLRERPGIGTLLNAVVIGSVMNLVIPRLPGPTVWPVAWTFLLGGITLAAVGSGLYIGAGLGPGPRDGLMTGIARRGHSVRVVRTAIELSALAAGWLLGGDVGIGTVVAAVTIGPAVHLALDRLALPPRARAHAEAIEGT